MSETPDTKILDNGVRKELTFPQPPEQVWRALTDSATLAQWLHPNDFEPRIGHRFTFVIAPKPEVKFDGLTVDCEVLELDPPRTLVISWSAGGPVVDTRVTFRLQPAESGGTHLFFEHSGFDLNHPFGKHAHKGAEYGWSAMLQTLGEVLDRSVHAQ